MTPTLHSKRPQIEKARAVLANWPQIVEAASREAPRGIRYRIGVSATGFSWSEWKLTEKQRVRQVAELGKFPENLWEAKHAPG